MFETRTLTHSGWAAQERRLAPLGWIVVGRTEHFVMLSRELWASAPVPFRLAA